MTYYDRQGKEIGLFDWADKSDDVNYRFLATETVGPYLIRTIWVGLDDLSKPPRIFETLITCQHKNWPLDGSVNKSATEREAATYRYFIHNILIEMMEPCMTKLKAFYSEKAVPDLPEEVSAVLAQMGSAHLPDSSASG